MACDERHGQLVVGGQLPLPFSVPVWGGRLWRVVRILHYVQDDKGYGFPYFSLISFFISLPMGLRGRSSTKTTVRGRLKLANVCRQCSMISASTSLDLGTPFFKITTARGSSPHVSSGPPMTATSSPL